MRLAYGDANVDRHAYTYGGWVGYAYCYGNAHRHVPGNLYDSY
jgi:hypothetical protein